MIVADVVLDLGGARRLMFAGLGRGWLWAAAGVVAIGLLVVLYRYERHLVRRRTGLALLGLRLAAAGALIVALFDPIVEHTIREPVRGRVVVGVDLSESMATPDPDRPEADREALRKALGIAATEPVAGLSRREIARRLLGGEWRKRIDRVGTVEAVGFARDAVGGTPEALAALLAEAPKPGDPAGLTTDWEPVLRRALADPDGAPVLGVVLLTDGRRNAAIGSDPAIERLKERGIPVFPVLIGTTATPRDAAIAAIQAPEAVDKGQTARIDVTIKADGLEPGTEVPVMLERPGASPLRQTVRAQADGGRPVVTFRLPLEGPGEAVMAVAVGPVDGDIRPDNDRRTVRISVADDTARVLLVDGEPRWEFQYLRNALVRDPRVELKAVVFRQPPSPASGATTPTYETALPAPPDSPGAADPLGAFDAIILGDVAPGDLDPAAWSRLESYVAARGGTLILSAGPHAWPALIADETARALLPVNDPRPIAVDPAAIDPARPALPAGTPIAPTASAAAGAWPMLAFADDPAASRAIWDALPRLPWALAGTPKPAATPLVVAVDPGSASEKAQAPDAAVIAAMPYGLGKVLWVGTDGTWRWRYRVGDAYHHRFWGQAVQWATRGKLTAGNRLVQFGPVPPRVVDGEATTILARFADEAPGVSPDLLVAARIFPAPPEIDEDDGADGKPPVPTGEPIAIVPLRAKADQPRAFDAIAPALPAGRYIVRLDVPALADQMRAETGAEPEATLEVRPRETPELVELAAARDPLDALAAATGGAVFTAADADRVADRLSSRSVVRARVDPTRLGERPEALILFFLLLTAEWVTRKLSGLP